MALERIDSIMDLPAILQEFAGLKAGLIESQKGLVDLFNVIKNFKDTTVSDLATNTDKLVQAINGSTQAQGKANAAYDALTQKIAAQAKVSQETNTIINAASASYEVLIKAAVRNKLANDDLIQSQKQAKKSYEDNKITLEQYREYLESIKIAQQSLKVSNADITKALNNMERQAQASGGSIDELRAKLNLLNQTYDKLSQTERESEGGQGLLKNIQDVDAALKQLEGDSGRFQRNVGNYSGAFKEAFKVLQDQLAATKTQMTDLTTKGTQAVNKFGFDPNRYKDVSSKTGAAPGTSFVAVEDVAKLDSLSSKAQLLETNVERLGIGFKTSRQESRAFQEAAVQLGLALGQTDDKFLVFNEAVGEVQNGINDIKAATKFQAQDAKFIVGLTSAVNGLVGAYGAASAAVSILGGDEEEAQQSMAKFQQLLVLINGLQQVANVLQEESGAFQLALAAKTSLAAAATKINTIITMEAIAAIHAQVEANVALAASEEAVVLTTEEAAAAISATIATNTEATASAIGLSLAEDAVAESAVVATGAVTGFGAAVVATGVGAIVVAVGVAVALLILKVREWMAATQLNTNQQKELNDALAAQIDSLQKINDLQDVAAKKSLAGLQHQLDLEEKSGQSNYAILALKQKIADKNAEIADSKYTQALAKAEDLYVKHGLTGINALHKAQGDYFEDLTEKTYAVSVVQKELDNTTGLTDREKKEKGISDKDIQRIKDRLARAQSAQNLSQKEYDFYTKGEEDLTKARNEQENLRTEHSKLTADEQRKVLEEGIKREADARKFANDEILNNNNSTLSQRLAAIKSNGDQEVKILQAQAASILSDPTNRFNGQLTDAAKSQLAQLGQQQKQALLTSQDEQTKIKRSYYERDRDANLSAYKTQLEDQIKAAQELQQGKQNNPNALQEAPKVGLSERLKALSDEYSARRDLLNAELKEDLDREGQTADEKKSIYTKYGSDITSLNKDFQKTYLELEEEARQKSLQDWNKYYSKRKEQIDENERDETVALNKRNLSDRKYAQQRQTIEDNGAVARASIATQDAEVQRNATKAGTQERIEADTKLIQSGKALSDAVYKQQKDKDDAKLSDLQNTFEQINSQSQNYATAIGTVLDIGYNTQKIHLEELEARQQRSYEQQVKNITDSGATQEQQAIRLRILDDQRATQKEANDRKQRQLDIQKAEFDKAKDILGIITGTALAVVKSLPNIPLAVSVGILGAAELAAAIATPLPHYKEGIGLGSTGEHPGGPAVVGDGGVKELILEPGKAPRWSASTPTIESLMAHTKVIPPHKIDEMMMSGMFVNHQGAIVMQASDNKKELRELKEAVIWNAHEIKGALAKNRGRTVINNRIDTNWGSYLNSKVFDKR